MVKFGQVGFVSVIVILIVIAVVIEIGLADVNSAEVPSDADRDL